MSESVKLQTGQIELGRVRDIRRAGIVILADETEILTLTYVPNSALVIIQDGTTNASGIGTVDQIGTPVEDAICKKINYYLGMKRIQLPDESIKSLLKYIAEWNNGIRPIKASGVGEIEGKGARAKKVFKVDLGRTIMSIDVDYKFTIDDGMGNSRDFELSSEVKNALEQLDRDMLAKEVEQSSSTKVAENLEIVLNYMYNILNELECKEAPTLIATNVLKLYMHQLINHKELEEAEKKKAEREEKNANKEPKKASTKDVLYAMIQDKVNKGINTDSDKINMAITPAGYGYDYEAFILEVVDPIYRFTQRKAVKESIETENKDSYAQYNEYGKIIDEVLERFVRTGKIDSDECVEYLNSFTFKEEK